MIWTRLALLLYFFMVAHKVSCQTLLKAFLKSMKVLLVLEIFLTEDFQDERLLCGAPSCSNVCLFFSNDLLRPLALQSVCYDLQHGFAWVADEADRSVVLALLQVAFLGKCDDQGQGPQGWPFFCLPDHVADCRESGDYVLPTCLDQACWDAVYSNSLPFLQ